MGCGRTGGRAEKDEDDEEEPAGAAEKVRQWGCFQAICQGGLPVLCGGGVVFDGLELGVGRTAGLWARRSMFY